MVCKRISVLLMLFLNILVVNAGFAEAPHKIDGVTTIGVLEAFAMHRKGAIFIDVRDRESWEVGHVEGALHLDFTAEEFIALYSNESLDRSTPIVFYANSALHNAGAMASYFAAEWGYTDVYFFRDGYFAWLAADAPLTMGTATTYFSKVPSQAETDEASAQEFNSTL